MKYLATLTTEEDVYKGTPALLMPDEVKAHLTAGELNAAIIWGVHQMIDHEVGPDQFDCIYDLPVFVAHTANPTDYYIAQFPPTDPDDIWAEGLDDLDEVLQKVDLLGSLET